MQASEVASLRPKVVIWDIDGTLWNGVIDSSTQSAPRPTVGLIGQLTNRGVVNSVCSNNEIEQARALLEEWNVLSDIVFEQIGWGEKLSAIARMLDFFKVAADAVVVVDDDARVREQLERRLGVITLSPELMEEADLSQWGDIMSGRQRLDHYKLLARRRRAYDERCRLDGTNAVAFLRESQVCLLPVDPAANVGRISELSYRSNRLNLTRSRVDSTEIGALVDDPRFISRAFQVVDRFGDYGICGFVVVEPATCSLLHFFWSCRVLNQGIVEFVADHIRERFGVDIRHPALVDFGTAVDWVSWSQSDTIPDPDCCPVAQRAIGAANNGDKILLIGGCDMDIVAALWSPGGSVDVVGLTTESRVQRYGHSSIALMAAHATIDVKGLHVASLPWVGSIPNPRTWMDYDMVVISLWADYSCSTLRHREDPCEVWAPEYIRLSETSTAWEWDHWVGDQLDPKAYFSDFVHGPALSPERLAAHVNKVAALASDTTLVLLGAPELDRGATYPNGADQYERNRGLNAAVRAACARHSHLRFFDISDIVTDTGKLIRPDDPTGFHYRRDVYAQITESLERMVSECCVQ